MSSDAELAALAGRRADERLLEPDLALLPDDVGRPPAIPADPRRAPVVGVGAALTGLSLVGGLALIIVGLVMALGGSSSGAWAPLLGIGAVLAATHWGWVHVAEFTAGRLESGWQQGALEARARWLAALEPYTRWTVTTSVEDDGAVAIERWRLRPVAVGTDRFTFERSLERREVLGAEESGAVVAERAELWRRQAAAETASEHRRFRTAAGVLESSALGEEDERERRAAARAASQALSEGINRNLREPPLVE